MVFNIHISVKSRKSVFSAISNELLLALYIPLAVKSYCKFPGFKLLYLGVGKVGFYGFDGNISNQNPSLYYCSFFCKYL